VILIEHGKHGTRERRPIHPNPIAHPPGQRDLLIQAAFAAGEDSDRPGLPALLAELLLDALDVGARKDIRRSCSAERSLARGSSWSTRLVTRE
jgi:hypothetical protein